jgi:hypothetical protein
MKSMRRYDIIKVITPYILHQKVLLGHQFEKLRGVWDTRMINSGAIMEFCSQVCFLFSDREIEAMEFFLAKIVVKVS